VAYTGDSGYIRKVQEEEIPSPGGEGRVRGLFLGIGEGQKNRAKPVPGKPYGFRTFMMSQVALYLMLGNPSEPESAFEFF